MLHGEVLQLVAGRWRIVLTESGHPVTDRRRQDPPPRSRPAGAVPFIHRDDGGAAAMLAEFAAYRPRGRR